MRGIILAGGRGTRLKDCTKVTNKHLLPVYDKPMIYYPIEILKRAGIEEVMIVTGSESAGDFLNLLGNGSQFGMKFTYGVQPEAGGIAQALGLCENFGSGESVAVILGDNFFSEQPDMKNFDVPSFPSGARIFLKEAHDPQRFGVAILENGKVAKIIEKPKEYISNLVVTGLYLYDNNVWNIIKTLKPSNRGELEITDVNNWYVENDIMNSRIINDFWHDCGTPDALLETANFIKNK